MSQQDKNREASKTPTFLETFEETTPAVIGNYRRFIEESKNEKGQYHFFAAMADTLLDAIEGAKSSACEQTMRARFWHEEV